MNHACKLRTRLTWTAMAAVLLALGASACSGGQGPSINYPPQLAVLVDSQTPPDVAKSCVQYPQDKTRGAKTYIKTVLLENIGHAASGSKPLCIQSLGWQKSTDNVQLSYAITGGQVKDPAQCPGAIAVLAAGKVLSLTVTYTPDPNIPPDGKATLVVNYTGPSVPPAPFKVCFAVTPEGATICGLDSVAQFQNVSAATPATQCFKFFNCGNADLAFKSAKLDPSNPQFTITKAPNDGSTIGANGGPDNADGTQSLEVCIQYAPDMTDGNDSVSLQIATSDSANPVKSISISASNVEGSFSVSCSSASGIHEYDFGGAGTGKKAICTVKNNGPATWVVNQNGITVVADGPSDQDAATAAYAFTIESPTGKSAQLPIAIAANKTADLIVTLTAPSDGSAAPNATLEVAYTQGSVNAVLPLPILGSDATVPSLAIEPATDTINLQAAVGKTESIQLPVGNQGGSSATLLGACVLSGSPPDTNPCQNGTASKDFGVNFVGPGGTIITPSLQEVPGHAIQNLIVEFHPQATAQSYQGTLLVTYCPGVFSGAACSKPVSYLAVNIMGSIDVSHKQPTYTLTAPTSGLSAGGNVNVLGKISDNEWPATYFLWFITARPAGSSVWLTGAPNTSAELSFVTDKSGTYEIRGVAQTFGDNAPAAGVWSAQATVKVVVP